MATKPRTTSILAEIADSLPDAALRARIAWLCNLTRAAAVGWRLGCWLQCFGYGAMPCLAYSALFRSDRLVG
jgi:hypothetical protein